MPSQGGVSARTKGRFTNLGDLELHNVLFNYPVDGINPQGERRFTFAELVNINSILAQRHALMRGTGGVIAPWRPYIDNFERRCKWRPRQFRFEACELANGVDPEWWYKYDMYRPLEPGEIIKDLIIAPEPVVHGAELVEGSQALDMEIEAMEDSLMFDGSWNFINRENKVEGLQPEQARTPRGAAQVPSFLAQFHLSNRTRNYGGYDASIVPRNHPIEYNVVARPRAPGSLSPATQQPDRMRCPKGASSHIKHNAIERYDKPSNSTSTLHNRTIAQNNNNWFQAQGLQWQIQEPGRGEPPPQVYDPRLDSRIVMTYRSMPMGGESMLQPPGFQNQPTQGISLKGSGDRFGSQVVQAYEPQGVREGDAFSGFETEEMVYVKPPPTYNRDGHFSNGDGKN